jgi:hypothetical protein
VAHSKTCAIQIILSLMFLLSLPLLIQRPLRRSMWHRATSRGVQCQDELTVDLVGTDDQVFSPVCDKLRIAETVAVPTSRSSAVMIVNDQNNSGQPMHEDRYSDSQLTMTPRVRRKRSSVPFLISFLTGKTFQKESHNKFQAGLVQSCGIPEATQTGVLVI